MWCEAERNEKNNRIIKKKIIIFLIFLNSQGTSKCSMCVHRKCWRGTKIVAEINFGYFLSTYDFFNNKHTVTYIRTSDFDH